MNQLQSTTYPDTNTSILQLSPIVTGQTWTPATMMNNNSTNSGYNPSNPYNININTTCTTGKYINST